MTKNSKLIFYLNRQQLIVAGVQLITPLKLDFPVNIVTDIDIIDLESYERLITNFLAQSKIISSDVLLVISPEVYYQKNITLPVDPVERQNQINLFLETIPFKNLIYKDYSIGNQPQIIALNKNFYEPLVRIIEKNGINISAIIPFFVLEDLNLALTEYLPKEVKTIFQKFKQITIYSLITGQDIDKITSTQIRRPKEDNTRAYILLAVFCLLFVVLLGFMYLRPRLIKPPQITNLPSAITTPTPVSVVEQITPTSTIIYINQEKLRIKVINSSGIPNQAAKIKQSLVTSGFTQITPTTSSVVTAAKNQITFSPQVSPGSRQIIEQSVEALAGLSTKIELPNMVDFDVLITITKLITQPTP